VIAAQKALSALLIASALVFATGCAHRPPPPAPALEGAPGPAKQGGPGVPQVGSHEVRNLNAFSFFGSANIRTTVDSCAGKVRLQQGAAVVSDNCFTGDTNVVICTDTTAPNPVMCAPRRGELAVAGGGNDTISYARVQ